jgi:hypothetical protein
MNFLLRISPVVNVLLDVFHPRIIQYISRIGKAQQAC